MAVAPTDRLLEIGCGHGIAVGLVCERLADGTITAIDRSAKMIEVASRRNAGHVSSGRAVFRTVALEDADFPGERFDKVFAVNVNLFWTRTPTAELALIRRLLAPGGALYLFYEPPDATRAKDLTGRLAPMLADQGYRTTILTGTTSTGAALVGVVAKS